MAERIYSSQYMILIRPRDPGGNFLRGLTASDQVYAKNPTNGTYVPIPGEPWIRFAVAYSLEDVRRLGGQAANAIGTENVKIVKVLPTDMTFEIQ